MAVLRPCLLCGRTGPKARSLRVVCVKCRALIRNETGRRYATNLDALDWLYARHWGGRWNAGRIVSYFCELCGLAECRCTWRDMDRQRIHDLEARGVQVQRVDWVCTHGQCFPTAERGPAQPSARKSGNSFSLRAKSW